MSVQTMPDNAVLNPPVDVDLDADFDFDIGVSAGGRAGRRLRALWRGREEDAAWVRPALLGLLAVTAVLYLWGLGASGWANSYYSAAVQAGTKSWKAFFFGSTDASNFVTVDKTPASLWVMEISARLFGVNSWSILAPQALEGVAAVGVLYATIRRWFSPAAALLAGATLALTPVAALMFRFNNPDALLVLLLTVGAYAMTRAVESGRTRWLVGAGACVGFAFLTKELQAFLVLPAFGLVYLVAGPPRLGRRIAQLAALTLAMIVSAGWWVAAVVLTPAASRPYIGGSQNNSFWNVLFGYNGFGRLTGNESGSVGGGGQAGSRWGPTGITRMFNSAFGGQISWMLPAALLFLVAGVAVTWKQPRTDRTRAALILWGGWLVVTGLVFSLSAGIIHEYYTVALAPAIGALVGIGAATFWPRRDHPAVRALLAGIVLVSVWWANNLLDRVPTWNAWLRTLVVVGGLAVAAAIAFAPQWRGRAAAFVAAGAAVVVLAAPAAYTLSTVATAHDGAIPLAGPATARGFGPGGAGGAGRAGGPGGAGAAGFGPAAGAGGAGGAGGGFPGGGPNSFAGGGTQANGGFAGAGSAQGGAPGGGIGGLLNGSNPGAAITKLLEQGSDGYRWVAATVGANNAAGYQLASGDAVMAIGGFNGTDPTPTLAQFEQYVRDGKIHYFIAGGGLGGAGRSGTASAITQWVENNFTSTTVSGVTVYDLTSPAT
jgi:4-amino-4-deoxy-L-arabinose transferase-like glycosyltransferase